MDDWRGARKSNGLCLCVKGKTCWQRAKEKPAGSLSGRMPASSCATGTRWPAPVCMYVFFFPPAELCSGKPPPGPACVDTAREAARPAFSVCACGRRTDEDAACLIFDVICSLTSVIIFSIQPSAAFHYAFPSPALHCESYISISLCVLDMKCMICGEKWESKAPQSCV